MGRRAVIIVLDGVGVGEAPDAADFSDEGSDTLGNTARYVGGLSLPNLQSLGLGNIHDIEGLSPADR
ncbi:MAG: phosphopentomutase, partial [Rubrobacter sp.]|nr:phosphopentomutase [Rubrobacter sp.]